MQRYIVRAWYFGRAKRRKFFDRANGASFFCRIKKGGIHNGLTLGKVSMAALSRDRHPALSLRRAMPPELCILQPPILAISHPPMVKRTVSINVIPFLRYTRGYSRRPSVMSIKLSVLIRLQKAQSLSPFPSSLKSFSSI